MASPKTQRPEIGVLYGFRAWMVLLVAAFHIWQQSWLAQYVTLFGTVVSFDYITRAAYIFVDGMILLSGFLLFLPHAQHLAEGSPLPSVKQFYLNRLIRILPSYLLAVLIAYFCFALPQGVYRDDGARSLDLWTHLTMTFTFFREPYQYTALNGVLWTIVIEMQFYLIFPLLAKAARKKPALTLSIMAAAGCLFRLVVYVRVQDTSMWMNQMPAFLDVYALGMLGALCYCYGRKWLQKAALTQKRLVAIAALCGFLLSLWLLSRLLMAQSMAGVAGYEELRLCQLRNRLPLAAVLLFCMLCACAMPKAFRWLLDNRLMRFCSAISFNFYIWHQILAVQYARFWFPDTLHSDPKLQYAFTALCFCSSLTVAMAVTFGLEQPVSKGLHRLMEPKERNAITHEGPKTGNPEQTTDLLLLRAEKGRQGIDREL